LHFVSDDERGVTGLSNPNTACRADCRGDALTIDLQRHALVRIQFSELLAHTGRSVHGISTTYRKGTVNACKRENFSMRRQAYCVR
jgi:hypothetical protein